jgi:N-acyl-D-amino-acid deacylase
MWFDLVLGGGTVFDGSGASGFRADVGIRSERIAAVGDLGGAEAGVRVDVSGLAVAPGFIDPHTHCHVDVDKHGRSDVAEDTIHPDNLLRQGITTVIAGNCGGSGWPIGEHLAKVEREGYATNYATLIGHHTVRAIAMTGSDQPFPDREQMATMRSLVRQGMAEGALGFTVGYAQRNETTEEIVEVTQAAADCGGIYANHIRSESDGLMQAVAEVIQIAEQTGIPVQVSHLKTDGPAAWPRLGIVLRMIEDAAERGIDIAADRYPYVGWHGGSTNVMPGWCYEEARKRGGKERLLDAQVREAFVAAVQEQFARFGGPDRLMFTSLARPDPEVDGKTAAELMEQWGMRLEEVALEIERRSDAGSRIGAVGFTMSEENLRRILAHPLVMAGTDGHLEPFGLYATHPRNYGTFPRVLGRYVREEGIMPLGEAIRKMTSFPAARFGIADRGWVRAGCHADLVVFDPATVADTATFLNAHQYPVGIAHVLVNGSFAVRDGATAEGFYGKVLRGGASH